MIGLACWFPKMCCSTCMLVLLVAIWAVVLLPLQLANMVRRVREQSQMLATAWANDPSIERLAVSHCLARVKNKATITRGYLTNLYVSMLVYVDILWYGCMLAVYDQKLTHGLFLGCRPSEGECWADWACCEVCGLTAFTWCSFTSSGKLLCSLPPAETWGLQLHDSKYGQDYTLMCMVWIWKANV